MKGIEKGVLTQTLGPEKLPMAYLSIPVTKRWSTCFRAVATTAILIKEADKLTLEKDFFLTVPYEVEVLLRVTRKDDCWIIE